MQASRSNATPLREASDHDKGWRPTPGFAVLIVVLAAFVIELALMGVLHPLVRRP